MGEDFQTLNWDPVKNWDRIDMSSIPYLPPYMPVWCMDISESANNDFKAYCFTLIDVALHFKTVFIA